MASPLRVEPRAAGRGSGPDGVCLGTTVKDCLRTAAAQLRAAGCPTPELDAEILLGHALGWSRARLYAELATLVDPTTETRLATALARRAKREPVPYIVGEKEFWSLPLAVDEHVLIPRPETERVVEVALELVGKLLGEASGLSDGRPLRVVDAGTGSGAIAVALAHELCRDGDRAGSARLDPGQAGLVSSLRRVMLIAVDLSAGALRVAGANARRRFPAPAAPIELLRADWTSGLGARTVDVVVANPPYVSDAELAVAPPELSYEPVAALLGGGVDGLEALRRLAADARRVLRDGGWLVSEVGSGQAAGASTLLAAMGFTQARVARDLAGCDRVVAGRWRRGPLSCEGGVAEEIAPSS